MMNDLKPSQKTVLLINPSPWLVTFDGYPKTLPLPLLALASTIYPKYKVILLDRAVKKDNRELEEQITNPDLFCVGLSVLTGPPIEDAMFISRLVRRYRPDVSIVWGGWHATMAPRSILQEDFVDYVVMGEGEIVFAELLAGLDQSSDAVKTMPGIGFRRGQEIHINPPTAYLDLHMLPTIPFELISDCSPYHVKNHMPGVPVTLYMESSRGCPYKCTFCEVSAYFGINYGFLSAEKMIERILDMRKHYGMDGIDFHDPNLFLRIQRIRDFANLLIARGIDLKWGGEGTIMQFKNISEEDLELFYRAGLRFVFFGIESGNQRVRMILNKKFSNEDVVKVIEKLHKVGIIFKFFIIVGLPGETLEESIVTLDFTIGLIDRYPPSTITASIAMYLPLPGTPLGEKAVEYGYKPPQTLLEFSKGSFNKGSKNLPWLTPKHARIVEAIARMGKFISFSDQAIPMRGVVGIILLILCKYYRFRLRRHWFMKTPDIMLLQYFLP